MSSKNKNKFDTAVNRKLYLIEWISSSAICLYSLFSIFYYPWTSCKYEKSLISWESVILITFKNNLEIRYSWDIDALEDRLGLSKRCIRYHISSLSNNPIFMNPWHSHGCIRINGIWSKNIIRVSHHIWIVKSVFIRNIIRSLIYSEVVGIYSWQRRFSEHISCRPI